MVRGSAGSGRAAEPALLRAALEAEVPVLGVCPGARLLAAAAHPRIPARHEAELHRAVRLIVRRDHLTTGPGSG